MVCREITIKMADPTPAMICATREKTSDRKIRSSSHVTPGPDVNENKWPSAAANAETKERNAEPSRFHVSE